MKKYQLIIVLAIGACSSIAMAGDEVDYSVSLKSWSNKYKDGATVSPSSYATVATGTARKGDYFLTGSVLMPATYTFGDGSYLDRRDSDIAVGWSVNPHFSLLGGVKRVSSNLHDFSGTSTTSKPVNLNISYIGVNGFTSLSENTFLYGTATRSFKTTSSRSTSGPFTLTTYEVGYGFVLNKNTQLSAGYRNQTLHFDSDLKLSGIIFGASLNF